MTKTISKGYQMYLTRNVTRSFDMYHEVEITQELIDKINEYLGNDEDYLGNNQLDLEHLSHLQDYSDVWTAIDDLHWNEGDIIFQEYERMPNQNYEDVVHFGVQPKTSLIEPEAL